MLWKKAMQQSPAKQELHSSGDTRILVVDDDSTTRDLVSSMLGRLGFLVTTVCDGGEAVNALKLSHYHIVLTDYLMPVMNGHDLARWVKQNDGHIYVVMMTGCDISEVEDFMHTGVLDDIIFKPFSCTKLDQLLNEVLAK